MHDSTAPYDAASNVEKEFMSRQQRREENISEKYRSKEARMMEQIEKERAERLQQFEKMVETADEQRREMRREVGRVQG